MNSKRSLPLVEKLNSLDLNEMKRLLQRIYDSTEVVQRRPIVEGPCLIYTKRHSSNGYGRISVCGKEHAVHLVAYMLLRGGVVLGYELDHTCFEPACWNPDHLVPRTHRENCSTRRFHGPYPNPNLETT